MPMTASGGQLGVVDENTIVIERPVVVIPPVTPPVVDIPVVDVPTLSATPPRMAVPDGTGMLGTGDTASGLPALPGTARLAGAVEPASVESEAEPLFSSFVARLSSGDGGTVFSPRALRDDIGSLDDKQRQAALAYIGQIIDNPLVPMSDKALFSSIRNELQQ